MRLFAPKDKAAKAELIILLKKIANNENLRSSDNIGDVFKVAFPDSKIVDDFSLAHTKAAYLITEALGPYFRKNFLEDILKR